MDDVSIVLLTVGEPSAARARASAVAQSLPPTEIVEIHDVRPFHRALNEGAHRVQTPFFVQLDADMVLDRGCVEALRAAMLADPTIGVVIGFLRDPLIGRISGVRMFRRACFDTIAFRDSVTPDTDFLEELSSHGWHDVYALHFGEHAPALLHTFGEHLPEYTAEYTWRKFQMEGARYVYRGLAWGLQWHLGQLQQSGHPMAALARVAMLQGTLSGLEHDQLGAGWQNDGYADFHTFTQSRRHAPLLLARALSALAMAPAAAYRVCHAVGRAARQRGAWPTVERALWLLETSALPARWVAQAGLCRGIMHDSRTSLARDLARLSALPHVAAPSYRQRLAGVVASLGAWRYGAPSARSSGVDAAP